MSAPVHGPLRIGVALVAMAAVALLAAAPAQAAGKTSAFCVHQFTATITPGFSPVPSSGTQTTHGETGSIVCIGEIAGHRVTGPGSIGFDMPYKAATCAAETGSGSTRATIPTTGGDQHLVGALAVRRTALAIRADAQFDGMRYSGIGVAIPKQGNCFITPLRQASIVLTGTLTGT